jgi:hypothetical protein
MLDHVMVSNAFYPYWSDTSIFDELLPDETQPSLHISFQIPILRHSGQILGTRQLVTIVGLICLHS